MANTYTQIYIQAVFAVQGRQSLIQTEHKDEIYKYISVLFEIRDKSCWQSTGLPIIFIY